MHGVPVKEPEEMKNVGKSILRRQVFPAEVSRSSPLLQVSLHWSFMFFQFPEDLHCPTSLCIESHLLQGFQLNIYKVSILSESTGCVEHRSRSLKGRGDGWGCLSEEAEQAASWEV